MPPGAVETLTWSAFVAQETPASVEQIANTVRVEDASGQTDEATAVTALPGQAVSLRQDATYEVYPGGNIVYTITVQNRGSGSLADVVVTDPIPPRVLNPTDISADGYPDGNLNIVWELGTAWPAAKPGC
jgi:uncharacterized repeat protein (TIGR01451 family)